MLLLIALLTTPAQAGWSDFVGVFAATPCPDGWAACLLDGERVGPELHADSTGAPVPTDMRLGWFDLEPTATFSAFQGLSLYDPTPATASLDPQPDHDHDHDHETPNPTPNPTTATATATTTTTTTTTTPPTTTTVARLDKEPLRPGKGTASVDPDPDDPDPQISTISVSKLPLVDAPKASPAPVTCDDLHALEMPAMVGKLSDGQIACLEASLAAASKQTDKDKISRPLMANAYASGDKADWARLVKRHLEEIDQSDPDLCYKYAIYLARKGPSRSHGVIKWANTALENRTMWTGPTYVSRVNSLYRLRAGAAQELWKQAEEKHTTAPTKETSAAVEEYRSMTKVMSREWYEYAKAAGKDPSKALQLCVSAAGTADYCEGH